MCFRSFIVTVYIVLFSIPLAQLAAQKSPQDFGVIEKGDFQIKGHDDRAAVMLFDYAFVKQTTGFNKGNIYTLRHYRLKIIKDKGLEWANISIPYYRDHGWQDKISRIRATVYNLKDGEITSTILEKKDIFIEQVNKNNFNKKFALANVRPGSIIEVKYEISSPFFYRVDPWFFQRTIPVLHSEYYFSNPNTLTYNTNFRGDEFGNLVLNDKSIGKQEFQRDNSMNTSKVNIYHWIAKDVPPFTAEPYISSINNHLGRVEFEVAETNFPYENQISYATTWEAIADQLANADHFGKSLKQDNFLGSLIPSILEGDKTHLQRIIQVYEGTKKLISWNQNYSLFATKKEIKKAIENGIGSSSEVNFTLICLLKAANLEAFPILISTRKHGYVNPHLPSYRQFNHVICAVQIGEDIIILDATDPLVPTNFIPQKCLNGKGLMIVDNQYSWVNLKAKEKYKIAVQAKLKMEKNGDLGGTIKEAKFGYAGYHFRKEVSNTEETERYVKELQEKTPGLTIKNYTFKNQDNIYQRIQASYAVEMRDQVVVVGEMMYLSPLLYFAKTQNPFKLTKRKYPIDFGYPIEEISILNFELPEEIIIEELPNSLQLELPKKEGKFSYTVKKIPTGIQVSVHFKIDKPFFNFEQYSFLKEFYDLIVEKCSEQIVLKRKT